MNTFKIAKSVLTLYQSVNISPNLITLDDNLQAQNIVFHRLSGHGAL